MAVRRALGLAFRANSNAAGLRGVFSVNVSVSRQMHLFQGQIGDHDVASMNQPWSLALDTTDRNYEYWERRTHALLVLMVKKQHISVDEFRRTIEGMPSTLQNTVSYYEKWSLAVANLALEKKLLTSSQLDSALSGDFNASHVDPSQPATVTFQVGSAIRIKPEAWTYKYRRPHLRTPGYIHGAIGTITSIPGIFCDPSAAAFGEAAPPQPLYRVAFKQSQLWPEGTSAMMAEGIADTIVHVDVAQPWMDHVGDSRTGMIPDIIEPSQMAVQDCAQQVLKTNSDNNHHHHNHHHDHHSHDNHVHEARFQVEANAVGLESSDETHPYKPLADAIVVALTTADVITMTELRTTLEAVDGFGKDLAGPRLVAKAWTDSAFKQRLLDDAAAAALELGIKTSNYDADPGSAAKASSVPVFPHSHTVLKVLENTTEAHNLVVCTLCSCYPAAVLGLSPPWYKSRSFRALAIRQPRQLLASAFGLQLADNVSVHVHDSTADLRYLVLPERPAGTADWSEEALQGLVTRDSMIGTAIIERPSAGIA